MYNHTSGYVISSLNLASCKYPDNAVVTYKTGLYLEALSVFADATQNVTLRQLWARSSSVFLISITSLEPTSLLWAQ